MDIKYRLKIFLGPEVKSPLKLIKGMGTHRNTVIA
jgi:hypothetical protein